MSDCKNDSRQLEMDRALCSEARSLREALLKEADRLEAWDSWVNIFKALGLAACLVGSGVALLSGGALAGVCAWTSWVHRGSLVPAVIHICKSTYTKRQLGARWKTLQRALSAPESMEGVTFDTPVSETIKSLLKKICIWTGKRAAKEAVGRWSPIVADLGLLAANGLDLARLCEDLHKKTPSESSVLFRECAAILETLIREYEQGL